MSVMHCLQPLTPQQFLADYWQQRSVVFRQVMPEVIGSVTGDDLAGLACEDDVESRIIHGYDHHGSWTCRQGPFHENLFATLPDKNWTLLIQGLDQYSDNIHQLLNRFDFLPRWRLEDIMASYAPLGGGVGPHFDYYDVFLIQVSGTRQWQLGQSCDDQTALLANDQVKLLETFTPTETHKLYPGDMIYIPAGQAHWGTATSHDCITFSVGFRSPSQKELLGAAVEHLVHYATEQKRYRDTLWSIDSNPAKINTHTLPLLGQLAQVPHEVWRGALQKAFGELVTVPRYPLWDEDKDAVSREQLLEHIQKNGKLAFYVPPSTRVAFTEQQLFVNGENYQVEETFSRQFNQRQISSQLINDNTLEILLILFQRGDISLETL